MGNDMKSELAHQLFEIYNATGSIVEFEYIYPSTPSGSKTHYKWLWTHLFKDRSTRGSCHILWTVTSSESSLTLVNDSKLLESRDLPSRS